MAFWNIRGAARKNALVETRDFCESHKIKILMLCEVKTQTPPSQAMINKCGFTYFDTIPPVGFSGCLWLLWKNYNINPFSLSVVLKASRFISCLIQLTASNIKYVPYLFMPRLNKILKRNSGQNLSPIRSR